MLAIRRLARFLPFRQQQFLRRLYYSWQIRTGRFKSDEPEHELLEDLVSEGDWVLDIGASVGHYTLKLSRLVGSTGRVFAFEPLPETFELLVANSRLFPHQNVTLLNIGLSDASQAHEMVVPYGETGLDGHYFAHIVEQRGSQAARTVFCCSADSLEFPHRIGLVKIDVEGHELQVLLGMRELLERDRPHLIVEANSTEVPVYLRQFGYSCQQLELSHNFLLKTPSSLRTELATECKR